MSNTREWLGATPAEQHDFTDRIFTKLKFKGRCVGSSHEPSALGAASRWLEPGEYAEVDLEPQPGEPGYKLNTLGKPYKTVRCVVCTGNEIGHPELVNSDPPWQVWNDARDEALGNAVADRFGAEEEKPF